MSELVARLVERRHRACVVQSVTDSSPWPTRYFYHFQFLCTICVCSLILSISSPHWSSAHGNGPDKVIKMCRLLFKKKNFAKKKFVDTTIAHENMKVPSYKMVASVIILATAEGKPWFNSWNDFVILGFNISL